VWPLPDSRGAGQSGQRRAAGSDVGATRSPQERSQAGIERHEPAAGQEPTAASGAWPDHRQLALPGRGRLGSRARENRCQQCALRPAELLGRRPGRHRRAGGTRWLVVCVIALCPADGSPVLHLDIVDFSPGSVRPGSPCAVGRTPFLTQPGCCRAPGLPRLGASPQRPYLLLRGGFSGFSICRASSMAQDSREPSRTHTGGIRIHVPA
jgi:hypothetical protein